MTDGWTDRLSEHLDGELSLAEREELETHLRTCARCRATLEDLRRVVARAGALEDRPPGTDLWPGIAERAGIRRGEGGLGYGRRVGLRERRFSLTLPQLVAASVALVTLSAGGMWMATSGADPGSLAVRGDPPATSPAGEEPVRVLPGGEAIPVANFAEGKYGAAIADLERVLVERRARLDPETVRAIEANLTMIDRAIEQARRALADDPASDYLNSYLAGAMRQKLDLLRRATIMTGASS